MGLTLANASNWALNLLSHLFKDLAIVPSFSGIIQSSLLDHSISIKICYNVPSFKILP